MLKAKGNLTPPIIPTPFRQANQENSMENLIKFAFNICQLHRRRFQFGQKRAKEMAQKQD